MKRITRDARKKDKLHHALEYSEALGTQYAEEVLRGNVRYDGIRATLRIEYPEGSGMRICSALNTLAGVATVDKFQRAYAYEIVKCHFAVPAHAGRSRAAVTARVLDAEGLFICLLGPLSAERRQLLEPVLASVELTEKILGKTVGNVLMKEVYVGFLHVIRREQKIAALACGEVITAADEIYEDEVYEIFDDHD